MRRNGLMAFAGLAAASLAHVGPIAGTEPPRSHGKRYRRPRSGSIADKPHNHEREIARRARQARRDAERQRDRAIMRYGFGPHVAVRAISRRGRPVVLALDA